MTIADKKTQPSDVQKPSAGNTTDEAVSATIAPLATQALNETAPYERPLWRKFTPRSLYARALIIIIAPIVILQSVLVFVFMERHWNTVTRRLSAAVTQDISAVLKIMEAYPAKVDEENIIRIAREQLGLNMAILPADPLPSPAQKPFFSLIDQALSSEISQQIGKPFWIDTVGRSQLVEIRIQLDDKVVQIFARRSQTYASNSHIFLFWMLGTAVVLLVIAIIFMRNQIKPIQRLANAAEDFGKGRDHPNFRPTGALEVRRASRAFIQMRSRIQRQIEQRTAMLAGVSHDLRTILTRFKLQLALLGDDKDVADLEQDVQDMQTMLAGYLDFAKGDADEPSSNIELTELYEELIGHAKLENKQASYTFEGDPIVHVRPISFKRCMDNIWSNAIKHADTLKITGKHSSGWLLMTVEDDGPGIPEQERENVFRAFYRLDNARNLNTDKAGTGLGLSIARDSINSHGGTIELSDSEMGGLKVKLKMPA
ncbi:MAG: ATP-binding protein [Hyphomicrobiales bacterium]